MLCRHALSWAIDASLASGAGGFALGFDFFPEGAVDFFVERRASGGVLAERMVFGPHEVGAVREGAADGFAVEFAVLLAMALLVLWQALANVWRTIVAFF